MPKKKCQNVQSVEIRIIPTQEKIDENQNQNARDNFIENNSENKNIVKNASEKGLESASEKSLEKANEEILESANEKSLKSANEKSLEKANEKSLEKAIEKSLESANENNSENDNFVKNVSENIDLFCYKQKRKDVMWTKEEEKVLREGIRRFGKGNWTRILAEYKDDFDSQRRYRDLSDKIRNIEHCGTRAKRPRMDFWEVDQNDEPICNKMGEPIIYFCKVPFEAAIKCAYSKNYTSGDHIIKICYEEADQKWYHVYNARFDKSARKCIQVRKIAGQSIYRTDGM